MQINHVSFPGLGIDDLKIKSTALNLFGGRITIAWYALIILAGILFAVWYVWRRFKENSMSSEDLLDLALYTIIFGVIGARVYYVLFSLDSYITGHFFDDLLSMIAIWNGGLAIYGAIIGGGIAAALVARHKKMNILQITDFLSPGVMMAQAIGRWGNFMNAEAHGGETSLPWRMGILEYDGWHYYHPTFLYESLWNFIGFFIIHFVFVKKYKKFNGEIFYLYVAWYGLGRMFIESLRTDSLYIGSIRVSQLLGFLALLVSVGLLAYNFIKIGKEKQNGTNN
jgi:phosphatidylglycerol:prolipoprotein diacylglycerol transferase